MEIDERFVLLEGFVLPEEFWPAFGYEPRDDTRFVSFYWTPYGDEAEVDDGSLAGTMNWRAYLTLLDYPINKNLVEDYDLGSSDTEARYRLLADMETGEVYVGPAGAVARFVMAQYPVASRKLELTEEDMERLAEIIQTELQEIEWPDAEKLEEMMVEDNKRLEALATALEAA